MTQAPSTKHLRFVFPALLALAFLYPVQTALANEDLKQRSGKYEVSLRLPADGLYAGEEMELEFHISDMSQIDPVLGPPPLIRADVGVIIKMPAMPGMPTFREQAHAEGVAGDYGVHPTFAHGGEYLLHLTVNPLADQPFGVDIPIAVADAIAGKGHKKKAPAYRVELVSKPRSPKGGEAADLQFNIFGQDKQPITQFDLAHERYLHLIIVREDLGIFSHEHPEMSDDGSFRIRYTFPAAGEYHLFADVAPKGAGSQVLMTRLKVSGNPGERYKILRSTQPNAPVQAGDLLVSPKISGPFIANKTVPITFGIADAATGKPASDLQPYLGAMGHLLMVHQDGISFVHSHPMERNVPAVDDGKISFLARFPKPGFYRAWAQFQRNGSIHTASFIIEAQ